MATTKKRINITLPPHDEQVLRLLAARDKMPAATKAGALLRLALEIEEDTILEHVADARDTAQAIYYAHDDAWK